MYQTTIGLKEGILVDTRQYEDFWNAPYRNLAANLAGTRCELIAVVGYGGQYSEACFCRYEHCCLEWK